MSFLAGLFVGSAVVLFAWLIGSRRRSSAPVLRPSITAGLEGLNAFPEPLALTEGENVVFVNTAFLREINDLAEGRTWTQWLECLAPETQVVTENAPPIRTQATGQRSEAQVRSKSGRLLAWTAVPFPGMGRRLILNIVRDVTATSGRSYDQALFMNRAAHELKTPVTAIKGYAELLQMYVQSGRPVSGDIADRIVQQSNRLVHLVNQLLDVARLGAGRLNDAPETLNLGAALRGILQRLATIFPDRQLREELRVEGETLLDPQRLEQIVRELVFNAMQYSQPETAVTVRAFRDHDLAVVEVADQGIGIPPQDQSRVFDRFARGSNVGTLPGAGGFGLGLFIAREILERWHGELRLVSTPGQGTTVTAAWPWRPVPEVHDTERMPAPELPGNARAS
jgi:signal transduction histidine kinase